MHEVNYTSVCACIYWQILAGVASDIQGDTSNATSEPNTPKNRYQDKIPCEETSYNYMVSCEL